MYDNEISTLWRYYLIEFHQGYVNRCSLSQGTYLVQLFHQIFSTAVAKNMI